MSIEIYTLFACQYCEAAKRLFKKRGLTFTEVDLGDNPELAEQVAARTGHSTTPYVFIDGAHIGGFDELVELDQEDRLPRA